MSTDITPQADDALALSPELQAELDALTQTGEELGGSKLDMLAIYSADRDRWKTGDTKKDAIWGVSLHAFKAMRSMWDPDAPMGKHPPLCWSLGGDESVPHEKAQTPQASACDGCPWDEFDTAKVGKGKACKTKRAEFLLELDPDKLERDGDQWVITDEAVMGIALLRGSSTSRVTRASIGEWAKAIRADARGIAQLMVTKWTLGEVTTGAVPYYGPVIEAMGTYRPDPGTVEEIVGGAMDFRNGEAEEILAVLSGRAADPEEGTA
jgi:hypothetical protein